MSVPAPPSLIVGLDVGKTHHHAVALSPAGERLLDAAVPQDESALRRLLRALLAQGPVVLVVDQPATVGALAVAVARDLGIPVGYLPGGALRRLADVYPGEAKTDARDAFIIANTARTMPEAIRLLDATDSQVAALTLLCGFDQDLRQQVTATSNRLRGLLTQIHPALERVLGPNLAAAGVLALRQRWPTPQALAQAGERRITTVLTRHGSRKAPLLAAQLGAALPQQTVVVAGTATAGTITAALAQQLATLQDQRATVAAAVDALVADHPLGPVLISMPGIGVRTAAWILVSTAGKTFASADQLASYAGLAPVTWRSGTSINGTKRPRGGNKRLKDALYQSAASTLSRRGGASPGRIYYDRKRREGKTHTQAVLALARRRVDVLYAMMRDGTCYQPPAP